MTPDSQPSLLSDADWRAAELATLYHRQPASALSASELTAWVQRLARFQAQVRSIPAAHQPSLFDPPTSLPPEDTLDPFALPPQNAAFWRGQFQESGVPALYCVVDHGAAVLLYVGETLHSNQRWKGVHDCKRYILNYVEAHRRHGLPVTVNIGFWPHAQTDRRARQCLESALIAKWQSPFNKENWHLWQTPFVGGKL